MNHPEIEIYTDGSCHTNLNIGAWAAILLVRDEKIQIQGEVLNTTHNRMELFAVIKAIAFASENYKYTSLVVYTDSQYVVHIPERMVKLKRNQFITKKGKPIQNSDLVQLFIDQIETHTIEFIKVKAHQHFESETPASFNSEVDKIARQRVREGVKILQYHSQGIVNED